MNEGAALFSRGEAAASNISRFYYDIIITYEFRTDIMYRHHVCDAIQSWIVIKLHHATPHY